MESDINLVDRERAIAGENRGLAGQNVGVVNRVRTRAGAVPAIEENRTDSGRDVFQLNIVRAGAGIDLNVAAGENKALHVPQQNGVVAVAIGDEEIADGSQREI